MSRFIDIISPLYQNLLASCERRKISINLDIQDLTFRTDKEDTIRTFYEREIRRALKLCTAGDKITLSQTISGSTMRLSVKNSSSTSLDSKTVEQLRSDGYEVRARFGFDTIITLKIDI